MGRDLGNLKRTPKKKSIKTKEVAPKEEPKNVTVELDGEIIITESLQMNGSNRGYSQSQIVVTYEPVGKPAMTEVSVLSPEETKALCKLLGLEV